MIIGAGLDGRLGLEFDQLQELGEEATELGFESLWTPAGGIPDAFHICGAWARSTRAVAGVATRTGTAVVPVVRSWSPIALAMQAATVGQLSDGKFVLGIGTGGSGERFFASVGLPNKPVAVMRDYLQIVRGLLRGEEVTHDGAVGIPRTQIGRGLPNVPVYLAALGPQMLRLGGAEADGVCLNWATPAQIAQSRTNVAEGARAVGRDPDEVIVSMYIRVCIDDDVAAARRAFATQVLGYALARPGIDPSLAYRGLFGRMGFEAPLRALEARREAGAQVADLLDDVPEDLLQAVGYYGTPAGAAARFAELSVGLDEAIVRVITTSPDPDMVRAALHVLTPDAIRNAA